MTDPYIYIYRGPKKAKRDNANEDDDSAAMMEVVPKDVHSIRVDDTVTHIPPNTFKDCTDLESVCFPKGLVAIGDLAFCRCRMLREISIPISDSMSLRSIGIQAFMDCRRLLRVNLPEQCGLQVIGPGAFSLCFELNEIDIPSSVRIIGNFAFVWCSKLVKVRLQEGLVSIGEGAFRKCTQLFQVLIPKSTREIGDFAFAECYNLMSAEISDGLQYLGHAAFAECPLLINVSLPPTLDLTGMDPFYQCTKLVDASYTNERLCQRYQKSSPIHQLCYEQAYYSTQTCMERLQEAFKMVDHGDFDWMNASTSPWADAHDRLTPFHVLAMSARPKSSLFQSLIQESPSKQLLCSRDRWGKTPLQYLSKSHSKVASQLIQMVLQNTFVQRIPWLGLSRWKREMWTAIDSLAVVEEVGRRSRQVSHLEHRMTILEQLEATSLLELSVWKNTLQYLDCQSGNGDPKLNTEEHKRLRHEGRFNCGSEIVIPFVLSWIDPIKGIEDIDSN